MRNVAIVALVIAWVFCIGLTVHELLQVSP